VRQRSDRVGIWKSIQPCLRWRKESPRALARVLHTKIRRLTLSAYASSSRVALPAQLCRRRYFNLAVGRSRSGLIGLGLGLGCGLVYISA
jgi:hypothetical protein